MGTETNLPPKFIFSSDFGHFFLKMFDYAKMLYVPGSSVGRRGLLRLSESGISNTGGRRLRVPCEKQDVGFFCLVKNVC